MPVPDLVSEVGLVMEAPTTVIAVLVAMATPLVGWLKVTTLPAMPVMVVPAAIPEPVMVAPTFTPVTEPRVRVETGVVVVETARFVWLPTLSTMAPATSPVPAVEPCRVKVLTPPPVAVKALVNLSRPVPD